MRRDGPEGDVRGILRRVCFRSSRVRSPEALGTFGGELKFEPVRAPRVTVCPLKKTARRLLVQLLTRLASHNGAWRLNGQKRSYAITCKNFVGAMSVSRRKKTWKFEQTTATRGWGASPHKSSPLIFAEKSTLPTKTATLVVAHSGQVKSRNEEQVTVRVPVTFSNPEWV